MRLCHPLLKLAPARRPGGGDRLEERAGARARAPPPTRPPRRRSTSSPAWRPWSGGADGIRVNVLHPNAVFDTGVWTEEVLASRAAAYGLSVEEYKAQQRAAGGGDEPRRGRAGRRDVRPALRQDDGGLDAGGWGERAGDLRQRRGPSPKGRQGSSPPPERASTPARLKSSSAGHLDGRELSLVGASRNQQHLPRRLPPFERAVRLGGLGAAAARGRCAARSLPSAIQPRTSPARAQQLLAGRRCSGRGRGGSGRASPSG